MKYEVRDVTRDPVAAQTMRERGWRGVPVITVDGQEVIGFDRNRLDALLAMSAAQPSRPSLGLVIGDASRQALKAGALPVFGALVARVKPGSPAERSGLAPGDIITEANLRPISNAADLEKVLESLTHGSRLQLGVMRGANCLNVTVLL